MKKKNSKITKVEIELGETTIIVDAETTMIPIKSRVSHLGTISLATAIRMSEGRYLNK